MILTCPACDEQYELPENAIGPKGRRVKCTTCAHVWLEPPAYTEYFEEPATAPRALREYALAQDEPAFSDDNAQTPVQTVRKPSRIRVILASIGLAIALCALTLGVTAVWRQKIVDRWSVSANLFHMMHLPVATPGQGLAFKGVVVNKTAAGMMNVKGKISNTTRQDLNLPNIIIQLKGAHGVLKSWPVSLKQRQLPAGREAEFDYTIQAIPDGGKDVTILFSH